MADVHALVDGGLVSYRQIDYWVRRGWLRPDDPRPGSGYGRDWSDDEVRVAERMARLVRAGLAPDVAARLAREDRWPATLASGVTLTLSGEGMEVSVG
jgi:hypothetical protein